MLDFLRGFLIQLGLVEDTYIPPIKRTSFQKPRKLVDIPIPEPKGDRKWRGVIIHHTASADGVTRDADSIAKYHTSYRIDYVPVSKEEFDRRKATGEGHKFEKPWRAIGYNYLIEIVGKEIVLVEGRPLDISGAHAGYGGNSYFNDNFIGLAIVGNFDTNPPPKSTWNFAGGVVRSLAKRYGFGSDGVLGHRETYARFGVPPQKSCPGAAWDMDAFRKLI